MKNIITLLFISIFSLMQSQIIDGKDFSKLSPEERHQLMKSLSPEKKRELLWKFREDMFIQKLNLEKQHQDTFRTIFVGYQQEQRSIKEGFNPKFNPDKLTDEEALLKIEKSFEVGEKLLNSRRKYAKELQKVLSPQQILKFFQIEGEMRDKMLKKHQINKNKDKN